MDGLTVSNSNRLLETGMTTSQLRNEGVNSDAVDSQGIDTKSFADTLKAAVGKVNELSQEADVQMQKLATGETKNIADVMITAEKATVGLKLMMQVRNKIIDAYQEIMKMQV